MNSEDAEDFFLLVLSRSGFKSGPGQSQEPGISTESPRGGGALVLCFPISTISQCSQLLRWKHLLSLLAKTKYRICICLHLDYVKDLLNLLRSFASSNISLVLLFSLKINLVIITFSHFPHWIIVFLAQLPLHPYNAPWAVIPSSCFCTYSYLNSIPIAAFQHSSLRVPVAL